MAANVAPIATISLTPLSDESRAALNAECIRRILAGMALPESVAPRPHAATRPSSVREGIERILGLSADQVQ